MQHLFFLYFKVREVEKKKKSNYEQPLLNYKICRELKLSFREVKNYSGGNPVSGIMSRVLPLE